MSELKKTARLSLGALHEVYHGEGVHLDPDDSRCINRLVHRSCESDLCPGQEERDEEDRCWARGEFDPVGDFVVSGLRLAQGNGKLTAASDPLTIAY